MLFYRLSADKTYPFQPSLRGILEVLKRRNSSIVEGLNVLSFRLAKTIGRGLSDMDRIDKLYFFVVITVFANTCLGQGRQEVTNSLGMKFVQIMPGTFRMGSPPTETGSFDNERQHEVRLSRGFYMGMYEVTQEQFSKVMGVNPADYQGDKAVKIIPEKRHPVTNRIVQDKVTIPIKTENFPVENVNWEDANEFCRLLSEVPEELNAGRSYRLPTEAEWEYACRAGSRTTYSSGNSAKTLNAFAWFQDNSESRPHEVGTRKPNAWGLYDMHGNVWEWCQDWYGEYPKENVADPSGPMGGKERVLRGGSWYVTEENLRSAYRPSRSPDFHSFDFGFRVVMEIKAEAVQDKK
jgi:formylglycine-generating enzyme required for sulfatase activity